MERYGGKRRNLSAGERAFESVNLLLLAIIMVLMIYPMYFTILASISNPYSVVTGKVFLWPVDFTLEAYTNVFSDARVWTGYRNTIYYTIAGTLLNLALTIPAAYVWSKKKLMGRNALAIYFLIPMYFSGGLMPTYLQVKQLGLINTPYALVLLGGVNIYNMIIARVYFQTSIPESIYESATIDGAGEWRCFVSIALPLAKPIIAVVALYYAVAHWNEYYNGLIYLSKAEYYPLQQVLRNILLLNQNLAEMTTEAMSGELEDLERRQYMAMTMKYALIFISSAPMLILYPFVQKFFVKGVMIGSVKG